MQLTWTPSPSLDMVSVPENFATKVDGHDDFLTVVQESSAWPILEPDEAARIIMQTQNLYKIYAFDIDSVAVAVFPKI
jgi:hypothetical protein